MQGNRQVGRGRKRGREEKGGGGACECWCLWMLEGNGSLRAAGTGGCELLYMSARNWTLVLCKSNANF